MLSRFYKRQSAVLLCLVAMSFPYLLIQAQSLPANNDIETWLPAQSEVRSKYEAFKQQFGVEEVVLVALSRNEISSELTEAICSRLDRLPGIRKCWSADRLQSMMRLMGVSDAEAESRLAGLALSADGKLTGIVATLSDAGLKNRNQVVADIRSELEYCQLRGDSVLLAGTPVVVAELDRLGGMEESQKFFVITLVLCFGLLYFWLRDMKLAGAIMLLTIWSINLTMAIFGMFGGEMNFILGALSVMVMVFTLEAAIHVLHYYRESAGADDPVGEALKLSLKPCAMSICTTAVGLFSVTVSDIVPVTQFGWASGLGAVIAMLTGLGLTPALLTVMKPAEIPEEIEHGNAYFDRLGLWVTKQYRPIIITAACLFVVGVVGVIQIQTKVDALDFLPKTGKVYCDVARVEKELTHLDSIEAVVDFGDTDTPFVSRLAKVRKVESLLRQHPAVKHTMSLSAFFPEKMPERAWELSRLLSKAQQQTSGENEFVTDGQRHWRISARIAHLPGQSTMDVFEDLKRLTAGEGVEFTGVAPLLQQAQESIFQGFWQSFASAAAVILLVMLLALRSIPTTILAMIPNIVPIAVVFGALGWMQFPVDIGMMMTGSIVLGITVDGTFHFLTRYADELQHGHPVPTAVRVALNRTGGPIFESIMVSSLGMLALTFSSFTPTIRFGLLMATLLMAALAGGLLLLPALLCCFCRSRGVLPQSMPSAEWGPAVSPQVIQPPDMRHVA